MCNNYNFTKITSLFIVLVLMFSALGNYLHIRSGYIHTFESQNNLDSHVTVVLDPGHGGEDGGACSYGGLFEKDLNFLISKEVYDMLSSFGINVIMTRYDDRLLYDPNSDYFGHKKSLDLAERLKISNSVQNSIFVSIHMNAFPEEKYRGLQVYYSSNDKKSQELALMIQSNTKFFLDPTNNRKVKVAKSNIYLLDRAQNPAILIECGFLSNAVERKLLNTHEYRKKLSYIIFCSILQYLERCEI